MNATQKCRKCGSPLRPCKCQRALQKAAGPSRKTRGALVAAGKSEAVLERARRATREDEEWARAYHSVERVNWTNAQPSVASGKGPCVNAHVDPDEGLPSGVSRKGDYKWIVPLTVEEHRDQLHQWGQDTFQRHYGIYLPGKAREHEAKWRRHMYEARGLASRD